MSEQTIVELLHHKTASLHGKVAAYSKFKDKKDFVVDAETLVDGIQRLIEELKPLLK